MRLITQNINEKGKQKIVTKYITLESGIMQGLCPTPQGEHFQDNTGTICNLLAIALPIVSL
jgi:hypothetical protein